MMYPVVQINSCPENCRLCDSPRLRIPTKVFVCAIFLFSLRSAYAKEPASDDVKNWHLLEPFWASPMIYRESVLFIKDGDASPNARLLLTPTRIVSVSRANGSQVFTADDYVLDKDKRRLTLADNSRIPYLKAEELFPPLDSPRSFRSKLDDPTRSVLFDNEHWFHDRQIEVTYETNERWSGYIPSVAKDSLKRTLAKLRNGEPLTIGVSGDSISFGLNASKVTNAEPNMPPYPELVVGQLEDSFHSKVTLINRSVNGWRLENALEDLPKLLESKPDLLIIAYGMNHITSRNPEEFKKLVTTMIDRIHAADDQVEIILVAPLCGNSQWIHTPREQFAPHRDVLASFVGPQIALCDMTTLWQEMLERKREVDLSGNGLNHPNDFGHRLYAQAILGLLIEMPRPPQSILGSTPNSP